MSCKRSLHSIPASSNSLCKFFAASTVVLQTPTFATVRGTFSLTCTAQGIDNGATVQEFKWYHNETEITADVSTSRFSVITGGSSSILTVTSTEREDGGEYYCQVFLSGNIDPITSSSHMIQIEGTLLIQPLNTTLVLWLR